MAMPPQAFGSVIDILKMVQQDRTTPKKKSNTITVVIGAVVTTVITLLAYLLENDVSELPTWLPNVMPFLGFIATIFGVSKTPNGITDGQIRDVENKINELISKQPDGHTTPYIPEPESVSVPSKDIVTEPQPIGTNSIAEELDNLAKNYNRKE